MAFKLLTNNAYWFQGHPSLWGQEQQKAHPELLKAYVQFCKDLDLDALCLQEVPGYSAVLDLKALLDMKGHYAPGSTYAAYGGGIFTKDQESSSEDFSRESVAGNRIFERVCMQAVLKWKDRSIRVMNVHLHSPRYSPDRNPTPFQLQELETILGFPERPDVLVGDCNFKVDSEPYRKLQEGGYVDALSAGPEKPQKRSVDHIWIASAWAGAIRYADLIRDPSFLYSNKPRQVKLSDHYPVLVHLDI